MHKNTIYIKYIVESPHPQKLVWKMATLTSHFFISDIMKEYKNRIKSTLREKNMTILNLEELLQYLNTTRLDIVEYKLRKTSEREKVKTPHYP